MEFKENDAKVKLYLYLHIYIYAKSFGVFPWWVQDDPQECQLSSAKDMLSHSCLVFDSFSLQGTGVLLHAVSTLYTASFAIAVLCDPRLREHLQIRVHSYHNGHRSVRGFFISFAPRHFCTVQAHEGHVTPNLKS